MSLDQPVPPAGYGTAFALWRAAAGDHWPAYTRHAFVAGLGDGSLPRPAFLHYLRQDYVFLIHFARAWALAVTKSDRIAEMRACAATVQALIDEEMQLHVSICAEAGIPEAELEATVEHPSNLAYTRYVLDAGHSGDLADLLAALAPCVLGYGEIGQDLKDRHGTEGAYGGWIATYGNDDYQQVCRDVGALIDGVLARRIGPGFAAAPRWPALTERFVTATRLEAAFWQMGLEAA